MKRFRSPTTSGNDGIVGASGYQKLLPSRRFITVRVLLNVHVSIRSGPVYHFLTFILTPKLAAERNNNGRALIA
jgi:hypothetical protein